MAETEIHISFLSAAVASAEATIRAYDTKAQIASAVFVLSLTPLDRLFNVNNVFVKFHASFVATAVGVLLVLLAFIAVLMPRIGKVSNATAGKSAGVFYLGRSAHDLDELRNDLRSIDPEFELLTELVKLSGIRRDKHARLKVALTLLILFYFYLFLCFLLLP